MESEKLGTYWSIFETLVNQGGVLYRRYHIQATSKTVLQLLVPPALREMVEKCHANILSGHQGETNTFNTLQRRFYWPTYRRDTKLFVQACERCQGVQPQGIKKAPLTQLPADHPMQSFAMDLIGPFDPPTDNGNQYILVMGDLFTKWVEAVPLPNKEATTCVQPVTEFLC